MNLLNTPEFYAEVAAIITAVAVLVTALKTHATVNQSAAKLTQVQQQTNGQASTMIQQLHDVHDVLAQSVADRAQLHAQLDALRLATARTATTPSSAPGGEQPPPAGDVGAH